MDKNIIDWLLDGPVWIKYAVETQLLGKPSNIQPVLEDKVITEILDRLKNNRRGISAVGRSYTSSDEYENPYWDLFFLADLGLTAADLNLSSEIEGFLGSQSRDGTFITEPGMNPTYFCKSAIMVYNAARLGYRDDSHVKSLFNFV
jgi:hypothetical protein